MSETIVQTDTAAPAPEEEASKAPAIKTPKELTQDEKDTAMEVARKLNVLNQQIQANAKFNDRVTELKACEGKTYQPKNPARGFENQIVTVIKYEGIASIDPTGKSDARNVRSAHIFLCESKNPNFRWKPSATIFLENFQEVEMKTEEINKEVL